MMTTIFIGVATMMLPLGMFLITISLVSDKAPISLYYVGWMASGFGLLALLIAFIRAYSEDRKRDDVEKVLIQSLKNVCTDVNNMRQCITTLNSELKQDSIERKKRKH